MAIRARALAVRGWEDGELRMELSVYWKRSAHAGRVFTLLLRSLEAAGDSVST